MNLNPISPKQPMPQIATKSTLNLIKRLAKRLSLKEGIHPNKAEDIIAKQYGYDDFDDALSKQGVGLEVRHTAYRDAYILGNGWIIGAKFKGIDGEYDSWLGNSINRKNRKNIKGTSSKDDFEKGLHAAFIEYGQPITDQNHIIIGFL